MLNQIEQILRTAKIYSDGALSEYLKLVSCSTTSTRYCEFHHILPKSMFPQFADANWNLVRLEYAMHREAHRLLWLMYNNAPMTTSYRMMCGFTQETRESWHLSSGLYGDANPSKRDDVREKISAAKTGKRRADMEGKKYFGASNDVIKNISDKVSKSLQGTVVVKDGHGNKFRVKTNDPRYVSGELVSHNKGVKNINSASKRPDVMAKIMQTRRKTYEKFKSFTFDEMVDFLCDAHKQGKKIFAKHVPFERNYSSYVKISGYNAKDLLEAVVQRLSKDGLYRIE